MIYFFVGIPCRNSESKTENCFQKPAAVAPVRAHHVGNDSRKISDQKHFWCKNGQGIDCKRSRRRISNLCPVFVVVRLLRNFFKKKNSKEWREACAISARLLLNQGALFWNLGTARDADRCDIGWNHFHCFAFRDHNEGYKEKLRGNFHDLVAMLAKYSPMMSTYIPRLQASKKRVRNFCSWKRQNQYIQAIATFIKSEVKTDLSKARFFSVSLDETSDTSRKEQFLAERLAKPVDRRR